MKDSTQARLRTHEVWKPRVVSVHSHVLGHGRVGDGRGGRVEAALAAHAAAVAAEAVHVGEVGVLRGYPPRPRVERILLVDVVVISFPGGGGEERQQGGQIMAQSRGFQMSFTGGGTEGET